MKQLYVRILLLSLVSLTVVHQNVAAQCNCSGGAPATPITHYIVLDTTNAPSSTISFPKFDPSIGTLTCITFEDTLTLVALSTIKNDAAVDVVYRFLLSVTNEISGPNINVFEPTNRSYGPTLLTAAGTPGDSIVYGPDTLFNLSNHSTSISNVAAYLGASGDVDFVYTVNGGVVSQQGGTNFTQKISSKYWGAFRLTYYWCPASPLNNIIRNFTAFNKDGLIHLNWFGADETPGVSYELEISKDCKNFSRFGNVEGNAYGNGYYTEYYQPGQSTSETLYFRVKRIDPTGKAEYSSVKTIQFNSGGLSYELYPNPAVKGVKLTFDHIIKGNMEVELLNTTGQRVFHKKYYIDNQPNLSVEWNRQPAPGIYYLRAVNLNTGLQTTRRLVIK